MAHEPQGAQERPEPGAGRSAQGPDVCIIIPCYNTARFIADAIRSALAQTYRPIDVLVVDDGSTDSSPQIVGGFAGVRCIGQVNQGVSEARNTGMRATTAEFVVFLDADDRLLPHAVEAGVRELRARPGVGLVYGSARQIDADGRVGSEQFEPVTDAGYARILSGLSFVPPAIAVFRRAALAAAGGFDKTMQPTEDNDMYLRVSRLFPIHCHNRLVADYRHHESNASGVSPARTLRAVLRTLDGQRDWVKVHPEYTAALRIGRRRWTAVFGPWLAGEFIMSLKQGQVRRAARALTMLIRYYPRGLPLHVWRRLGQRLGRGPGGKAPPRA